MAAASDHSLACLFVAGAVALHLCASACVCVCVCAHVWLSLSGQVWRQSGRVGLVIEEAIEKGASH